jgi:C4-dicarboxylate transporter DctM subunit
MEFSIVGPFILLFVLYGMNMSVAYAMLVSGLLGIIWNSNLESALGLLQTSPYRHSASFLLTTIPMFILMAEFLSRGRMTADMFRAASDWLGRIKGGLAMSTVFANAGFAALSGSSTAAAASMGRVTVPEMRRYGYDERLSMGTVAAAGTFASMIPPSVGLIIYGVITETSIGALFIAGIIPGMLTVVGYLLLIYIWVHASPGIAPLGERTPIRDRIASSARVWPAILLVVILVGGIYSGAMTPTEAGSVGAFFALLISFLLGGLRGDGIFKAISNTAQTTGMILLMIIGASVFGGFLALARVAPTILDAITSANLPPFLVVIGIVLLYLFLGMFMDMIVMMLLTLPLTFPLVVGLGYDPIWFGILVIKCGEIGLISPPFGLNIFVAAKSAEGSVRDAFAGSSRFLLVEGGMIVLLLTIPQIATYLPSLMER